MISLPRVSGYARHAPLQNQNEILVFSTLALAAELLRSRGHSQYGHRQDPKEELMRTSFMLTVCLIASGCNCGTNVGLEDGGGLGGGGGSDSGTGGGSGSADAGHVDGGGVCLTGALSLAVTPADSQVTLTTGTPSPVAFTANATFANGSRDVTSSLSWSASRNDDTAPGSFASPGSYLPLAGTGGTVTITATDGCLSASTTIAFKLESTFRDPGPTVTSRFAGPVVTNNAAKQPGIIYPSDQTRFPRNIYKILFQWKKGGNDAFRLTFEGPFSKTVVYSDGVNLQCQATTAGCLEADLPIWTAIAGANAGAVTTLTIDGVTQGDSNVYRAPSIQLGFSKRDVKGAIFYWSTTAAGIRRASVSDRDPEAYVVAKPTATVLPNSNGSVKCVACHTVSRSGKKIAAFTQASTTGEFVYDVTLQPPPVPVITTQMSTAKGFATFRIDDQRVVSTVGNLLAEFDATTGTKIINLPGISAGTNPDWSPANTELVYSDQAGDSPGNANLKAIAYTSGNWGAIRTLVPAAGASNLFPSYSPDGAYVAYARGKGGHGDKTFQLWLAKSDGSVPPVELINANRVVNSAMTLGQHENNMPTWAPPGDLHWVAFNSVRPYGAIYPNGGTQQIWVTAIDPAKLGQRSADGGMVDPSYPAFRFAFQGLNENNHRAFWTLDVRDPIDAGSPTCAAQNSVCGTCCEGLVCTAGGELGSTCQPPSDGGTACIGLGEACSQTGGAACCEALVCDVGADGGAVCYSLIN